MSVYADVKTAKEALVNLNKEHRIYAYIKGTKQYVEIFPTDIEVDDQEDIIINVKNTGDEDNLNTTEG